jgi:hypothetical protein
MCIDLCHRSWIFTEDGNRKKLKPHDIEEGVENADYFDFAKDLIAEHCNPSGNK